MANILRIHHFQKPAIFDSIQRKQLENNPK